MGTKVFVLLQVHNEQIARELCDSRAAQARSKLEKKKKKRLLVNSGDGKPVVPLVVRGDVVGSLEVLVELLGARQPEELELSVVSTGVGDVTEGDLDMAQSTGGSYNSIVLTYLLYCT